MGSVGKAKDQPLVPGNHDLEHSGFIDLLVGGQKSVPWWKVLWKYSFLLQEVSYPYINFALFSIQPFTMNSHCKASALNKGLVKSYIEICFVSLGVR